MTPKRTWPVVMLVLVGTAGCGREPAVSSYTAPKEPLTGGATPAAAPAPTPPAVGTPVRTLAVIVPVTDSTSRFVKLLGPLEAVNAVEADFRAFAQSLQVSDKPDKPLEFTVPDGWKPGKVSPMQEQMRQVTFRAGPPEQSVEIYISAAFGGDVLQNVNRWRGEVGLADIPASELPTCTSELKLATGPATFVDLKGTATRGGMGRGPFQK